MQTFCDWRAGSLPDCGEWAVLVPQPQREVIRDHMGFGSAYEVDEVGPMQGDGVEESHRERRSRDHARAPRRSPCDSLRRGIHAAQPTAPMRLDHATLFHDWARYQDLVDPSTGMAGTVAPIGWRTVNGSKQTGFLRMITVRLSTLPRPI